MLVINQWEDVIPQEPVHEPLTKDDYETYPESEPPYMIPFKKILAEIHYIFSIVDECHGKKMRFYKINK